MNSGGHRDAAELLSQKLHFLFQSLGADRGPAYIYDMDLLTTYCEEVAGDDLNVFMSTEFGQGWLICNVMLVLEELETKSDIEAAERREGIN